MTLICNYKFPCHPEDMFDNTPDHVSDESRMLRVQMITTIAELSQTYSQEDMDNNIIINLDSTNNIVGMDMSFLLFTDLEVNEASPLTLGKLTQENWTNMKIID